jgi:very-short-patch-repair endonuclease
MTLQRALVTRKKELTDLTSRAQELRHDDTLAEMIAWSLLRNRQVLRYKFRRQVPLGSAIVDFYCASLNLVIELDGAGHAYKFQATKDRQRDLELESEGYRVLRFPNGIVLKAPLEFLKKVNACIATLEQARLNELLR